MASVQNVVIGYLAPKWNTPAGTPCRVMLIGRPPSVPNAWEQHRWRCTSVREANHTTNPWQTDPGTYRTAKATLLRVLLDPAEVEVQFGTPWSLHGPGRIKIRRYPIDQVVVEGRFKIRDTEEHDFVIRKNTTCGRL
jgi:hypothetical protein